MFPKDVSTLGNFRPYDTIALGVKTLAKWLHKKNGFPKEKKINVWYTGHSLGCATASLVCVLIPYFVSSAVQSVDFD